MKLDSFYGVIGLERGATVDQIRRAYRRLALFYHPDHNVGDRSAHEQFVMIAKAYRILMDYCQSEPERRPDECGLCGRISRLYPGTDGRTCCADCLLGHRARRLLPHPFVRHVRFFGVMVLWLGAIIMLIYGAAVGSKAWLTGSLSCVVVGMVWLAAATIWISLTVDPRLPISTQREAEPPTRGERSPEFPERRWAALN